MIDGLLVNKNRTKKPLATVLSGAGRAPRERDGGGDLANVQ
jgi:hypothetical protein